MSRTFVCMLDSGAFTAWNGGMQHHALALAFAERFPISTDFSVEDFADWAVGRDLLKIPNTQSKDDPRWAKFVGKRLALLRKIGDGGSHPRMAQKLGTAFTVEFSGNHGSGWRVVPVENAGAMTLEKYAEFVIKYRNLFRGGVFNLDAIDPIPLRFQFKMRRTGFGTRLGPDGSGTSVPSASYQSTSAEGSYENWMELRRMGAQTIPVFHVGEDPKYLKKYMDETEYIGIGAIARLNIQARISGLDHIWNNFLKKSDGTPRCRVHGMGLTDQRITLRYPWFSVDSFRAVAVASYGHIFLPRFVGDQPCFDLVQHIAVSNQGREHQSPKGIGLTDSFFAMPQRKQTQIREFCASLGYTLDETLTGRKLMPKRPHRKMKDPLAIPTLDIPDVEELVIDEDPRVEGSGYSFDDHNLSASWIPRFALNLHVLDEFVRHHRRRGKVLRIYNVVGGSCVLDVFAEVVRSEPAARLMVSHARMSQSVIKRLRRMMNGTHAERAG